MKLQSLVMSNCVIISGNWEEINMFFIVFLLLDTYFKEKFLQIPFLKMPLNLWHFFALWKLNHLS